MNDAVIQIDETSMVEQYGVGKLVGKLLAGSSLTEEQIQELLHGKDVASVSNDTCVLDAVALLNNAKQMNQKVFIAGDFDCDGVCSTAILKYTFEQFGIEHGYYIPNRLKEGYGLSKATAKLAMDKGYTLFITCDNGVKCFEAIDYIHSRGGTIIVSDHHTIEEDVPCDVLVHPDCMDEAYSTLCGAGVVLQISRHLIGVDDKATALAAIASIGDVMPLWKETRCIVKEGFKAISRGKLPSIVPLLYSKTIDQEAISFNVVPALNAVGRLSDEYNVNQLIPYLISDDFELIQNMVVQLKNCNSKRKKISSEMVSKAESMIEDESCIVLHDESFHLGICGLAAGKIADTYKKPTIIMAPVNGVYRGSGRSIPSFNLFDFFASDFDEYLEAFGGHKAAVGISVKEENFDAFVEKVKEKMEHTTLEQIDTAKKGILISSDDITVSEIEGLLQLNPYPKEMIENNFAIIHPVMEDLKQLPKVNKYHFKNHNRGFDAICFPYQGLEIVNEPSVVIGKLSVNVFRNECYPQMMLQRIVS